MSKVVDITTKVATPLAEQCGLEIVEIEYKRTVNGMELVVFIDTDKEGGVSLNDCEKLHRLLDASLDELDITDGAPYRLTISSPGLDRPLKTERDYARNTGKQVDVSLYEKGEFGKKFVATLKGYNLAEGVVQLTIDTQDIEMAIDKVAHIKQHITF